MLRITDARTGETVDAVRARRGLTRVEAHVERDDLSALRVLLVADVLARALELGGTPVATVADPPAALRARADALGIRRAEGERGGAGPALHVLASASGAPEGPAPGRSASEEAAPMDATSMGANSMGSTSMGENSTDPTSTDPTSTDPTSTDPTSTDPTS
ncbi:hypothetical protein ABZV80_29580, partial [Streptomyces sp. NPDC005132]